MGDGGGNYSKKSNSESSKNKKTKGSQGSFDRDGN